MGSPMNGIQPSGFQCLKGEARVAEVEAAETQVWLEYSVKCEYLSQENGLRLHKMVDQNYRQISHDGQ